jgi:GGDEF domain-containing protein
MQEFESRIHHVATRVTQRSTGIELSVSVGAACYPEDGDGAERLLSVAEERMFASKYKVRNPVAGDPETAKVQTAHA